MDMDGEILTSIPKVSSSIMSATPNSLEHAQLNNVEYSPHLP